jgi:AcrR family transcriptional regulator
MKEEILQTSLKQFLKHGIREMSILKLIEPLGISTKTVYKYFKNKEELLEEALLLFHSQQYQILQNRSQDQNAAVLLFDIWYYAVETEYKINNNFFRDLHYYYPELASKTEAAITEKFNKQFLLVIRRGMEQKVFRKDINPEVVLEGIFTLYRTIGRTEEFKSFRVPTFEIFFNTIALYIRGFSTEKGIQELDKYISNFSSSHRVATTNKKITSNRT